MEPSEVAAALKLATGYAFTCGKDVTVVKLLADLADSFDQPGDGPLAYSEAEGRMVRLVAPCDCPDDMCEHMGWHFPAALEAEQ